MTLTETMPTPDATITRMPRPSVTLAHHGLRCLRPVPRDLGPVARPPDDLSPDDPGLEDPRSGDLSPDARADEDGLGAGRVDPREEPDDPEPFELPYVCPPRPS